MNSVKQAHRRHASVSRPIARRRGLLTGVGGMALVLAGVFPSTAWARGYPAGTDAELRQAILDANADGDLSSTITLTADIAITGALPASTNTLIIDTAGFSTNGIAPAGLVTLYGTIHGNDDPINFTGQAGLTTASPGGITTTITNYATITGGSGSNGTSTRALGANIQNNGNLINNGTITGGSSGVGGLSGGLGMQVSGNASVVNNGTIQGGAGLGVAGGAGAFIGVGVSGVQSFTNNATGIVRGGDGSGGALGGAGIALKTLSVPIVNYGLIEGGNGAVAIQGTTLPVNIVNGGIIRAGAGGAVAMDLSQAQLTLLELQAGSSITGLVIANASAGFAQSLQLGGNVDSSFDMSLVGAAGQYRNFNRFVKVGTSTWMLTGNASGLPTSVWELQQGTLLFDAGTVGGAIPAIIGSGALIFQQNSNLSVGNINGAISVLQSGSGTTTLVGNNHSGGTTITAGKLSIGSETALGTGAFTISGGALQWTGNGNIARSINWAANGAGIEVTPGASLTLTQPLLGGGALLKSGAGTLILSGDNTYVGGTTIAAGTLRVNGSILGDVQDDGLLIFGNSAAYTYTGQIRGGGALTTSGAGLLTLTGSSDYNGATTVNGSGGLLVTNRAIVTYRGGTTLSAGQLLVNGGAKMTSGGPTTLSSGNTALAVDGQGSAFGTAAMNVAGNNGRVVAVNITNGGHLDLTAGGMSLRTQLGTARFTIDGTGSQADMTGGLTLAAAANTGGAVTISGGGALHTAAASTVGTAAGNAQNGTTRLLDISITGAGSNWTSSDALLMTNGRFMLDQGGAATFTNATFGTVSAALPATLTVSGANSRFRTSGDLVIGSGAGTGALTLSDGGAVNVAGSLVLADVGTATGILNTGGGEGQAAAAAGAFTAPSLALGSATSRINFNHTDTDYIFGAAISGAGAINQVAGDTNLTGNSALFTGTTIVSGGALRVNGTLGSAASLVNVQSGGRLGGAGTIGGNVTIASGGTLAPGNSPGTLTIAGDLALSSGSLLDYEFGHSDVVGGPLNDLTVVGGNLTLAGTIDVTATPGGNFDVGLYRVISYGGTLNDQGLAVGTMPADAIVQVQTSIAHQVNLVNIAGVDVNFWDGGGAGGDGIVSGGSGIWRSGAGSDNWTLADGTLNTAYYDGAFAIFSAAPGTVTVDGGGGAVTASGLQFASDGYILTGDAITLTAPQSVIRVGDGTLAGAGYTATIASALTSDGDLEKRDLGTLVLTGADSVAGDLYVRAGELRLGDGGTMSSVNGWIGDGIGDQARLTVTGRNASGGASTWTVGGLSVGSGGTGELTIADGGKIMSDGAVIGEDSAGQALVTGTGSAWQIGGRLNVGLWETGALRIADGALVSSQDAVVGASAHGDVVVTGPGTSWISAAQLTIGSFGSGTLRIEDGASVTSDQGYIGANADGSVVVTGPGSNWQVTRYNMTVGNQGNGALTIEDGGLVHAEGGLLLGVATGASGSLALNGTAANRGVLETSQVGAGRGTVTFAIDGGLVRATRNNGTFFTGFDARDIALGANGGVIDTNGYSIGIAPRFTGAGALIKDGEGVLTLTGANSYTGDTTIAAGVLQLGNGGTAGSIVGDVANNGSLVFFHSDDIGFSGLISGTGSVVQNGPGVLTLTAGNSYAGQTLVNAGTLRINGDQSAATGLTTVFSGATLAGSGVIGGSVDMRDGATLAPGNSPGTLTINGNLSLAAGSTLAYEFGARNTVGGPLNDLVNVGGNLTLDGTLNVTVPAGGSFDIGLYRVFNYAGTLTDNGLALGTMPTGPALTVQTSIAGQVNLVNTGGALLNFWDGSAGANKLNNMVDGGSGMWRTALDNSWTEATGAVNAAYDNGAFAIFAGTGGLVTIDNSLGTVTAAGLQFATTNYRIQGDALTLTGPQSVIRVGDGTSAGLGYSVIITSEITGSTQLVKTDVGRLELLGTNSYTGGTAINGGTLRISRDANLGAATGGLSFNGGTLNTTADLTSARAVDLAGQGVFSVDAGTTLTLTGNLTGAGLIGKLGAGTLVLGGTGSQTGGIEAVQGALFVTGDYRAATGPVTIDQLATLGGTGTIGGNVNLRGTLAPGVGGVGTLTINGDLLISQSATLAYELGQANVSGGALNDLVNVGGNLTLDGTLNVSTPAGGDFGAGVYRLINYGGTLTDNGLTLGSMPGGSNVAVQTSVAGQVNLINFAGLSLNFWDGASGPKGNGVINGGSGAWQNGTGNDNWTDANGVVNAAYSDGAFAVFGGSAGTVTVDNSLGAVTAAGMQFAASGYTINGDPITLTAPQSVIRVGDGSSAGAGFVATINAALAGDAQLVKTDAGTLVVTGTNSYTGGTAINGGTLQIARDASLGAASGGLRFDGGALVTSATFASNRAVTVAGAGTIATANATTLTLAGPLSGSGALTKTGAGTLLLTGNGGGYTGATTIAAGTLAVTGTLGGTVNVASGARLEGTGSVGGVTNLGIVAPGRDGFGTLTAASYTGAGGRLEIETVLGGDASQTDRLVTGATAGRTTIDLVNRGGLGAQTVEGIKIVDVTGASDGTFLLHGDYAIGGEQAVIAGAYGYRLYKGGVATPTDGDWYLRSTLLVAPEQPQVPLYQPGVPVYEAYGQTLLALTDIGTMQQRTGNRQWAATESGKPSGIWGRMQAGRSRPNATVSTSLADVNVDSWKMEIGADHVLSERGDGASLVLGVLGGYGEANASIASVYGGGSIKTKGYSAGATLTWFGPKGFYIDGRAQATWFDSRLRSAVLGTLADGNHGFGQTYSLEVGKRAPVGAKLSVTPQIQMVYQHVTFDRFSDPHGAAVSSHLGGSLKSRWGLSVERQDAGRYLYGIANLSYEWLDGTVADVAGTPIRRENHRLWGELGVGGSALIGNRLTLFGEASANTAINDFGKSYSVKGNAGIRLAF
ncbi:autotransporter outer membrane beta-barrel domain-containing protein [Sphingomonas sp.]|uniref:autotransporter outer membrane beta-barrel domain-containing protein n=3 Tax=unclassified Sphingomonas TaxID=196159 RepID=UPI002580F312|nr:autotransporter outer membrane beta-barrel domain-containing protein [Sphingomonas sp.]